MPDTYTVTFTGHRYIDNILQVEMRLEQIIRELIQDHEYVEFLVGRDGEFDQIVSSTVIRMKKRSGDNNCALVWVMPYINAEYENNNADRDNSWRRFLKEKASDNNAYHPYGMVSCDLRDYFRSVIDDPLFDKSNAKSSFYLRS